MPPLRITCLTCKSRLRVDDLSTIGQIVACPKCGGMVQVVPPPGWEPDANSAVSPAAVSSKSAAPSKAAAAPATDELATAGEQTAAADEQALPPPQAAPSMFSWQALVATAATLLLVGIALWWSSRGSTSKPLVADADSPPGSELPSDSTKPGNPSSPASTDSDASHTDATDVTAPPAATSPEWQLPADWPARTWQTLLQLPAREQQRLAQAQNYAMNNQQLVLGALGQYAEREAAYPAGVIGQGLLPPETRLSWIAQTLPYLDRADWHTQLRTGRSWNDAANEPITRRQLDLLLNPSLAATHTADGYPVTHIVGLSGWGPDAAALPEGDPRAGVFGYQRRIAPQNIPDGASQTIALVGVTRRPGAWAAGGEATIRSFTQEPYIGGPDGLGDRRRGLIVGMADGSVRTLSPEIDPEVLRRLSTVRDERPLSHDQLVALRLFDPPAASATPAAAAGATLPEVTPGEMPPADASPADAPLADLPPVDLPPIDGAARLAEPLVQLELKDARLIDVARLVSSLSGVPISFDLAALQSAGKNPRALVTLDYRDGTLGGLLDEALERHRLEYTILDHGVQIGAAVSSQVDPAQPFDTLYDVADLGAIASPATLAQWVQQLVAPQQWRADEGHARLSVEATQLRVRAPAATQQQVAALLQTLRRANERPTGNAPHGANLVSRRVSAYFPQPEPLGAIAVHLERVAGVLVLIDDAALATLGKTSASPSAVVVYNEPLGEALGQWLKPLGLAWRIIDGETLEITTPEIAHASRSVEPHDITTWLLTESNPTEAPTAIAAVRQAAQAALTAPQNPGQQPAAAQGSGLADEVGVVLDAAGRRLWVSGSAEVQRSAAAALERQ